jgi:hypothetical protein
MAVISTATASGDITVRFDATIALTSEMTRDTLLDFRDSSGGGGLNPGNPALNVLGGGGSLLRQGFDFGRDDREFFSSGSGARGRDGCIERQ